jgi:hypothetical protein
VCIDGDAVYLLEQLLKLAEDLTGSRAGGIDCEQEEQKEMA